MDGIVEALLRLEGVKHTALIEGNAPAYEESVSAQLHLLDSVPDMDPIARRTPDKLLALSLLIRHNIALFLNLASTSVAFSLSCTSYSSLGNPEAKLNRRIQVKG